MKSRAFLVLVIFLLSFGALRLAPIVLQSHLIAGLYFHGIPSETMMQTVSVDDLKHHFLQSLWNIHIQPPLFDLLRGLLAIRSESSDPILLQYDVDRGLYLLWTFIYGLMSALIFWWLAKVTNGLFAFLATLFFIFSPAVLLYATLLETTFLSSFLILCFVYLLWKIQRGEQVSPWMLAISFLALFFTRSIFQWQWLVIVGLCLWILRYPAPSLRRFLLLSSLVVGLFVAKQFALFGITSTSSFTGLNLCQSIQACKPHFIPAPIVHPDDPSVLVRSQKLTGAHNFNNRIDLELNQAYLADYKEKLKNLEFSQLLSNYYRNFTIYFQPSSNYASTNTLLAHFPGRVKNYYEKLFSAPVFPALIMVCGLFYIFTSSRRELMHSVGIAVPVIAILMISILFESGENMRFKFFVEPILYIFIATQIFNMSKLIGSLACKRMNLSKNTLR